MGWIKGIKPSELPPPSLSKASSETPVQVGKSNGTFFSITTWNNAAIRLKITGLWIAQRFHSLIGNKNEVTRLKLSIRHNEIDLIMDRKVTSLMLKGILVESRNMMHRDQLKTRVKRDEIIGNQGEVNQIAKSVVQTGITGTKFRDFILSESKNANKLKLIEKITRSGVCAGACLDFASKILKSPNLSQTSLITVAEGYKSGIPAAGVANQIAYARFSTPSKLNSYMAAVDMAQSRGDFPKKVANFLKQSIADIEKILTNDKEIENLASEFNKAMAEATDIDINSANFDQKANELANRVRDINNRQIRFAIFMPLIKLHRENKLDDAKAFFENLGKSPELQGDSSEAVETWIKSYLSEKRSLKATAAKPTSTTEKISNFFKNAKKTSSSQNVETKPEIMNVLSPYLKLDVNLATRWERMLHIAKQRGVQMGAPLVSGEDRLKSNVSVLQKFMNSSHEDGVYSLNFKTGAGAHATLLIKSEDAFHFWDPNFGLFNCGSKPYEFIADFVERIYDKPNTSIPGQEQGTNNYIEISAFTKLEQSTS